MRFFFWLSAWTAADEGDEGDTAPAGAGLKEWRGEGRGRQFCRPRPFAAQEGENVT